MRNSYERVHDGVYIFPRIDKKCVGSRGVWQLYACYDKVVIRKSLRTTDREIAVERAFDHFKEQRKRILLGHPIEVVSFEKLCDDYMKSISGEKKAEYQKWPIETYYRKFFGPRVNDLAKLTDGLVADYIAWRKTVSKTPPKAKTLNRERTAFLAMMKFAVRKKWLSDDQVPTFDWQRESADAKGNYAAFTSQEWSAFLSKARSEMSRAKKDPYRRGVPFQYLQLFYWFAKFMVYTGIRPDDEFRNMQWRKINLKDGHMYVDGKKGERLVPLNNEAIDVLKEIKVTRQTWLKANGERMGRKEFVWCLPSGHHVKTFKRQFKYIMDRMENLTHDRGRYAPYSFRHTFATFRIKNGAPAEAIMKAMGTGPGPFYRSYNQLMSTDMKKELFKNMRGYEED